MTMPYPWWKQFNGSDIEVRKTIEEPVNPLILGSLQNKFSDFRRAYEEDGLGIEDFNTFGPTVHTVNQFLGGFQELLALVRERMLAVG
jgi:transaldolase